jgi:hypothetical protein
LTWLSGWQFCKAHAITGSTAGAQTNYQVGFKVYYGAGTDGNETINGATCGKVYCNSHCKADFGDLRFTSSDGLSLLDYWVQESSSGNYAIIWVEVDSIPASPSTKTLYMYYGNPSATTLSNGSNTFHFFDDFDSSPNGWSLSAGGSITNGNLQLNSSDTYLQYHVAY